MSSASRCVSDKRVGTFTLASSQCRGYGPFTSVPGEGHSTLRTTQLLQRRQSATTTRSTILSQKGAKEEVYRQLSAAQSFPARNPALEAALKELASKPTPDGGPLTLKLGQGTWEVVSAPHIVRLSEPLGTTFSPIRYTLSGNKISSNVRFCSSVFREGWLSASGTLDASDAGTVQVKFDRFWVDFGVNSLRRELTGTQADAFSDTAVAWLGRLFFFPQLSFFPVLFVDSDLAIFTFPPLKSDIAVRRIG